MARDRQIRIPIIPKHIIQHLLTPNILICRRLPMQCLPELVRLAETLFNPVTREILLNISFVATAIARVSTDTLAKQLFHRRDKWVCLG